MRIRGIKPEFFEDQTVGSWEPLARVLYMGLPLMADDAGRLQATPRMVWGTLACQDKPGDVERALGVIVKSGKLVLYEVGGEVYGVLVNFWHQRIDKTFRPHRPCPPDEVCEEIIRKAYGNPRFRNEHVGNIARMFQDASETVQGLLRELSGNGAGGMPDIYGSNTGAIRDRSGRSRARASGAGSREQGTGNREQGAEDALYRLLAECRNLQPLSFEQWLRVKQAFPRVPDLAAEVRMMVLKATNWSEPHRNPADFVWNWLSRVEKKKDGPDEGGYERPKDVG